MKDGIHPNYREICFQDMSNGFKFVTRSCANTKETITMEDGREVASVQAGHDQRVAPLLHRHSKVGRQHGRPRGEVPQPFRQDHHHRQVIRALVFPKRAARATGPALFAWVLAICRAHAQTGGSF